MKNSIHIIILTLLLFTVGGMFGGCSSKQEAELRALEQWMDTNPDSVISVLEAMDPAVLKNPRINALHILTLIRAIDKKRVLQFEQTDDSLINVAVDYFGRKGPEFDYMRSLFYAGSVNYYIDNYDKAMRYAMRAEKIADKLGDDYWMAKIAELQGFIFSKTYNFSEEFKARSEAAKRYYKTGYELNSLFATLDVACVKFNIHDYDFAVKIVDSIMPVIKDKYAASLLGEAYHLLLLCRIEQRRYDEANSLADSVALYYEDGLRNTPYYFNLAYLCMNKQDTVGFFDNINNARAKAMNMSDSVFVFDALVRYYENGGDYKRALSYVDSILKLNNRQVRGALEQSGTKAQREVLRSELRESEWEARWRGMMIWVVGVGFVISIIMLCGGVLYYRERIRRKDAELAVTMERFTKVSADFIAESKRADELSEQVVELKGDMEERDKNNSVLMAEIGKMFKEQWCSINNLCAVYLQKKDSPTKASIYMDLEKVVEELRSKKSQQRIIEIVNTVKNGLVNRFCSQCAEVINDKSMPMTIYLFAGLSLSTVSMLLNINYKTLYARRNVLIKRIGELAPEDAEEFISELKG